VNTNVLFGLGLDTGVQQVNELLEHAHFADDAGLDVVGLSDHPYFAERIDAYAALGFVLGATSNIAAAVIMTNLLSRPAPIFARTAKVSTTRHSTSGPKRSYPLSAKQSPSRDLPPATGEPR
jgi:hypothetical protein